MTTEKSLWNLDKGKTKAVIGYIKSLEPLPSWSPSEIKLFERRVAIALEQASANMMLIHIGYVYKQRPVLYSYVTDWGKSHD